MAFLRSVVPTESSHQKTRGATSHDRSRRRALLMFSALGWSAMAWPAAITPEYQLKAVFLFNFTQFVDWPPQAFDDTTSPLVIGVLGADPFGMYLDDTVRGETVNGRPLTVQRFTRTQDISNCHVLFISRSEITRQAQILNSLKGRSILTVGESEAFTQQGGMIRFTNVNNKIRLRIALQAARTANLTLSSNLLRPAEVIDGEG